MFGATRLTGRFIFMASIGLLLLSGDKVRAQHEPMGGSTKDIGSVSPATRTPRKASKPSLGPTTPAATTPRRRTTPAAATPARRTTTGSSGEEYNRQGDEYFNDEKYDQALDLYRKAVQANPAIASAHYHIG